MNQVVCNKKDECTFKGCISATEHRHSDICDTPCKGAQGVKGALCEPVPTDLFGPLTPPWGKPAQVRCDTAGEAGTCEGCDHGRDHEIIPFKCHTKRGRWFSCPSTNTIVHCNPVPEQAKPRGVAFKGTPSQLFRYLGGLTDERFQAMMHAGITIDTAPDLVAEALRVQEEANEPGMPESVYSSRIHAEVFNTLVGQGAVTSATDALHAADTITARIAKLPRP